MIEIVVSLWAFVIWIELHDICFKLEQIIKILIAESGEENDTRRSDRIS